jgi:hypothetical protein
MSTINPNFDNKGLTMSQFISKATFVASSQAGTVVDKKELDVNEPEIEGDSVNLSDNARAGAEPSDQEKTNAASHAGIMSDMQEQKEKKKKGPVSSATMFGGKASSKKAETKPSQVGVTKDFEELTQTEKDQLMTDMKIKPEDLFGLTLFEQDEVLSIAKTLPQERRMELISALTKSPKEILSDVPQGFVTAAKGMVEGKMKQGVPDKTLTNLKEVPDTSLVMVDYKPLKYVEILPIHDTGNKSIPLDFEADLN